MQRSEACERYLFIHRNRILRLATLPRAQAKVGSDFSRERYRNILTVRDLILSIDHPRPRRTSSTLGRAATPTPRIARTPCQVHRVYRCLQYCNLATPRIYNCHPRYPAGLQLPPQLPPIATSIATPATQRIYNCHPF